MARVSQEQCMLTTWGDSTEEDEVTEEEDVTVALMAKSDSDSVLR